MKKVKRLIEIKRQLGLNEAKIQRADKRKKSLVDERTRILKAFTEDEKRLYKDKIERACR